MPDATETWGQGLQWCTGALCFWLTLTTGPTYLPLEMRGRLAAPYHDSLCVSLDMIQIEAGGYGKHGSDGCLGTRTSFHLGHTMKGKLITTLLASDFSFWPSYVNSFALPSPPFCLFISEVHPADKLHIIQPWFGSRLSWEIGTDRGAASPAQQLP